MHQGQLQQLVKYLTSHKATRSHVPRPRSNADADADADSSDSQKPPEMPRNATKCRRVVSEVCRNDTGRQQRGIYKYHLTKEPSILIPD